MAVNITHLHAGVLKEIGRYLDCTSLNTLALVNQGMNDFVKTHRKMLLEEALRDMGIGVNDIRLYTGTILRTWVKEEKVGLLIAALNQEFAACNASGFTVSPFSSWDKMDETVSSRESHSRMLQVAG